MDAPISDVLSIEKIAVNDEEISGFIALATINRPNKLNALNSKVMEALKNFCAWAEANSQIRCIVITGAKPLPPEEGKRAKPNAFVAGADISEFVDMDSKAAKIKFTDNAVEAIWNLTKPSIAMIDGFALGGGCEVACSCDIRIASTRSKFGTPEINLGLIPGYGATQSLSKLIGYGKSLELILTGAAKRTIRASLNHSLDEGIAIEAEEFAKLFDSKDKVEGVNSFMARTKPKWHDS